MDAGFMLQRLAKELRCLIELRIAGVAELSSQEVAPIEGVLKL
jgi:hypothetical protein